MRRVLLFGFFALFGTFSWGERVPLVDEGSPRIVESREGKGCDNRYYFQPGGPFAAMVFCEGALGNYISVVYNGHIGVPWIDGWKISEKVWQDPSRGSDFESFAWGLDGQSLFVGQGGIYGNCGIYKLDLKKRTSVRVFPDPDKKDCAVIMVQIKTIQKNSLGFEYQVEDGNEKNHGRIFKGRLKF